MIIWRHLCAGQDDFSHALNVKMNVIRMRGKKNGNLLLNQDIFVSEVARMFYYVYVLFRFKNKAHALAALAHFTRLPSLARSSPPELKATVKTPSPHSACCQIVLRLRQRITCTSRLPDLLLSP